MAIRINTDKLIPGEYYWVRASSFPRSAPMMFGDIKGHQCFYYGYSPVFIDAVESIDCDTEGNPIPIKRPE